MKKVILFSALLIIITLLGSCNDSGSFNNSERYHLVLSNRSGLLMFVCDSKTGKVYFYTAAAANYEETWDPIKKTMTIDSLKIGNKNVGNTSSH